MAVEFRQLEYFVAVAEERHFTRAARRLHIAQSGLSAAIRSLERELGAELFIRSTRSVDLTDAGRALLVEARHALGGVTAAREAVAAVQGVVTGRLAVGTMQCLGVVDVPQLLARFHHAHPGVEIQLEQGSSTDLIEKVRTGTIDVALVALPAEPPPGVGFIELATEPMLFACGAAHPLAARDDVALADVKDEKFVDFHPGWFTRDITDNALAAAQIERRVLFEVNDVHSLLDLVSAGLGVALVSESLSRKRTTARFVPLRAPVPTWRTGVATVAGRRPSAAACALLADPACARPTT